MTRRITTALLLLVLSAVTLLSIAATKPASRNARVGRDGPLTSDVAPPRLSDLPQPGIRNPSTLDEVVLAEDFEQQTPGALPSDWSQVDQDQGYCSWFHGPSQWQVFTRAGFNAHGGSRFVMCAYNDGAQPNDDWLILPLMNLSGAITLRYWAASQDTQYLESFEVRVSTSGSEPAAFTDLIAAENAVPVAWTAFTSDLSAYAGIPFRIAIHYHAVDRFVLKVDDIVVEGTPPASGTISGVVTDVAARPVDNATVQLLPLSRTLRTDTAGRFLFSLVPVGTYALRFMHPYYFTHATSGVGVVVAETTFVEQPLNLYTLRFYDYVSTNSPRPITDFDTAVMAIYVPDTFLVADVDVTIDLNHAYDGDLKIWLEVPDRSTITLIPCDPFRSGRDIHQCRFDDAALNSFTAGQAPYVGRWRPLQPLSRVNGDTSITYFPHSSGNRWQIFVYDSAEQDIGVLYGFQLHMVEDTNPAAVPEPRIRPPLDLSFAGNYPNPFNDETRFRFELSEPGSVRLLLYNVLGQPAAEVWSGPLGRGAHEIHFNAAGLSSGLYLARLSAQDRTITRKMLLIK